jgi:hypothetical protein
MGTILQQEDAPPAGGISPATGNGGKYTFRLFSFSGILAGILIGGK